MKAKLTSRESPQYSVRRIGTSPRAHYLTLTLLLATIGIVFAPTLQSMLQTWLASDTFFHGVLIFPLSAYLIWLKRRDLTSEPTGYWAGVPGLWFLSLIWWFADALSIQVLTQLAVIAMIVVAVVTVMGPAFARGIAFPLGYLFFAVPMGEGLVPYLIDYTAAFTVEALNVSGIPVFRDGRYFSIPAGDFEVARACSGIRYLLATLALGTLFAYVNFRDAKKRVIFVLLSVIVAIAANGLRAYGIVLLAHFISLELAAGVDHIIFGWIFFGVIVTLMFWIGSRFSDHDAPNTGEREPTSVGDNVGSARPSPSALTVFCASTLSAISGPVLATVVSEPASIEVSTVSGLPSEIPGWSSTSPAQSADWYPEYRGAVREIFGRYARGDSIVDAAILQYRGEQQQGGELASSDNSIVDTGRWRIGNTRAVDVRLQNGGDIRVNEAIVYGPSTIRIIWFWYDVDGQHANDEWRVKLLQAKSMILGRASRSSLIAVSIRASRDLEASRALILEFVQDAYGRFTGCVIGSIDDSICSLNSQPPGVH